MISNEFRLALGPRLFVALFVAAGLLLGACRPASQPEAAQAVPTATAVVAATATARPPRPEAAATTTALAPAAPAETARPSPSPTAALTATAPFSPTATVPPGPTAVNGVPIESVVVIDSAARENVRRIFANGQRWGRDPQRFSKLGDSLIATPHFLTQFDTGPVNLGEFDFLAAALAYYQGSFERYGVAVHAGLHSWAVFDPLWANKDWCLANEDLLTCELRLNNPSILLILLGSNDSGSPGGFNVNLRRVVQVAIDSGVVPVLATKADRFEGPEDANNAIIRQVAADYAVPLWDFDRVAATLPERGLGEDGVHLSTYPEANYADPLAFERGYAVHNLTCLLMLDAIREITADLVPAPDQPATTEEG